MRGVLTGVEIVVRVGLIGGLLILWALPASYFDRGPIVCYWQRTLGVPCPGCGLTRGTQHFLHGDWQVALEWNPLSPVVGTCLVLLATASLMDTAWRFFYQDPSQTRWLLPTLFEYIGFLRRKGRDK
ncbi:MAG: DUF2752 domain-containing protein [Bacteroidetes bacterium]|nr:MAG: DUF2752 domain-containing protein [Bacteroidota bacterium]